MPPLQRAWARETRRRSSGTVRQAPEVVAAAAGGRLLVLLLMPTTASRRQRRPATIGGSTRRRAARAATRRASSRSPPRSGALVLTLTTLLVVMGEGRRQFSFSCWRARGEGGSLRGGGGETLRKRLFRKASRSREGTPERCAEDVVRGCGDVRVLFGRWLCVAGGGQGAPAQAGGEGQQGKRNAGGSASRRSRLSRPARRPLPKRLIFRFTLRNQRRLERLARLRRHARWAIRWA